MVREAPAKGRLLRKKFERLSESLARAYEGVPAETAGAEISAAVKAVRKESRKRRDAGAQRDK